MKFAQRILGIGLASILASGCTPEVIDKYWEPERVYWNRDLVMLYPPTYETRKHLTAEDFVIILKDVYGIKTCHTSAGAYAPLQIGDTLNLHSIPYKPTNDDYVYYREKEGKRQKD